MNGTPQRSAKEFKIEGPGLVKAIQESVDKKMNITMVTDVDNLGNLVRVGYFFISRETGEQVGPIQWFKEDEITVTAQDR